MHAGQSEGTPQIEITLVHGTWGNVIPSRRVRWFEPQSEFRTQLEELLPREVTVVFREFLWSGANSIAARSDAAARLARELSEADAKRPMSKQVVIAHSHGGNLALDALRMAETSSRVPLITMGTPFIEIKPIEDRGSIVRPAHALIYSLVAAMVASLATLVLPAEFDILEIGNRILAINLAISVCMLIGLKFMVFSDRSFLKSEIKSEQKVFPVLVVRSMDDEAHLALMAGAVAGRLSIIFLSLCYAAFILSCLAKFGPIICAAILAIMMSSSWILAIVTGALFVFGEKFSIWRTLLFAVPMFLTGAVTLFALLSDTRSETLLLVLNVASFAYALLIVVMFVLLLLISLARCINGRELIFGGALLEINVQSVPDIQSVQVITLPSETKASPRLQHSIYRNSGCPATISKWMAAEMHAPHARTIKMVPES